MSRAVAAYLLPVIGSTRMLLALALAAGCTDGSPRRRAEAPREAAVPPVVAATQREPAPPAQSLHNSDGSLRRFPAPAPDLPGRMHVYTYGDFGPQALASQLLGSEVYTFGPQCCFEPDDEFDVRVVVYAATTTEEAARRRYPSGPTLGDHRIVGAAAALAFVEDNLRELQGWPAEDRIPTLEQTLAATRDRLRRQFPARP